MWSFVTDTPSAVQTAMLISCLLMGLSHLLHPQMWGEFFAGLIARGRAGLVTNQFINATPGAVIVALHQVWSGPAILLTIFGWMLLAKSVIGLLVPALGMRSLRLSEKGDAGFRAAGVFLLAIAAACALQLAGVWVPA